MSGRVGESNGDGASESSPDELERLASEPCPRYRGRPAYRFTKRSFDVAASAIALTLLSPLLLGVAIAVKVTDPGPAVFRQKRVGAGKDLFDMYKFRTMRVATPELPTHLIDANEWYTPIGATLRRLSLDELPQLANILKGDMSFVGPRPALWSQFDLVCERDRYGANAVRPGLTGWAQINGRDELSIEDKARFDGEYLSLMGPLFDLRCMLGTVGKVAGGAGIVEERACGEGADRNHTTAGAPVADEAESMGTWPNS